MKVEVKELPKHGREILFEIDKEKVAEEKKKILDQVKNSAEIPGFRPGKAPEQIVETKYREHIRETILKNLISRSYMDAVSENKLSPIIEPEVSDVKLEEGLNFKVYIEVKPDVQVKKYTGLSVKKVVPEPVKEEEVEENLKRYESKQEFASSIIDPEKRRAWKEKIREQLERYHKYTAERMEEAQLWEQLFENSRMEIPEKMLAHKTREVAEEWLGYMNLQGKNKDEFDKTVKETLEKAKPEAEKQLKRYFILNKVAELEKTDVTEEELTERIQKFAATSGERPDDIRKKMEQTGRIDDLKEDIKIDKAFQLVRDKAQWIEKIVLPGEEHEPKKSRK